jgi:hypothetical protein
MRNAKKRAVALHPLSRSALLSDHNEWQSGGLNTLRQKKALWWNSNNFPKGGWPGIRLGTRACLHSTTHA